MKPWIPPNGKRYLSYLLIWVVGCTTPSPEGPFQNGEFFIGGLGDYSYRASCFDDSVMVVRETSCEILYHAPFAEAATAWNRHGDTIKRTIAGQSISLGKYTDKDPKKLKIEGRSLQLAKWYEQHLADHSPWLVESDSIEYPLVFSPLDTVSFDPEGERMISAKGPNAVRHFSMCDSNSLWISYSDVYIDYTLEFGVARSSDDQNATVVLRSLVSDQLATIKYQKPRHTQIEED